MEQGGLAAAHRWDQRQLVVGRQRRVGVGVLAVDRHHQRQPVGQLPERVERVLDARAFRQLQRQLARAGALAQDREQLDRDLHESGMLRAS